MTSATLDRFLAVLVIAMAATGLLTLRAGTPDTAWLYAFHGLLAGALALAIGLKLRGSVPRAIRAGRRARLALGLVVAAVAAATLAGGYLWVASGRILSLGSWTVMTLHAWAGLALVALVVWHVVPRRWRVLRTGASAAATPPLTRRSLLIAGAFGVIGAGAWIMASVADQLRGGERRFTGSRFLPPGGVPPSTTFLGEPAPAVDPAAWRMSVSGAVGRPLALDLAMLTAIGVRETTAVLDCTSGWALETTWRGVRLADLLATASADPRARRVVVRSETGWSTSLTVDEASRCLLATGVAGAPLVIPNGAPVRLVAPDRRGLDWVKWVREIVVEA